MRVIKEGYLARDDQASSKVHKKPIFFKDYVNCFISPLQNLYEDYSIFKEAVNF